MTPSHRTENDAGRPTGRSALRREAEARLTDELREAVGDDRAQLPGQVDIEHPARPMRAALIRYRLPVGLTLLMLIVVAGIVSFATDSLWVLPLAIVLHAIGTVLALGLAVQLATETEHAGPETAALLEDAGVADPDALLTSAVDAYADEHDGAAAEAADQRGRVTPASRPTAPSGGRPVLGGMPVFVVAGALLVSVCAPIVVGEAWLWILPVVAVIAVLAWAFAVRAAPDQTAGDRPQTVSRPRARG